MQWRRFRPTAHGLLGGPKLRRGVGGHFATLCSASVAKCPPTPLLMLTAPNKTALSLS